jgi:threonine-phosphate decarboxylase
MEHGGDLLTYKKEYAGELIDFSSNINPLGTPEGLHKAIIEDFDKLEAYPDILYRELKESVADYLKCESKNIILGNGAVEIINNCIMFFDRVVLFVPSFSEYELRARVHKKELLSIGCLDDFSIRLDILKKELKKGDLLILGNPNNPTGLRIPESTLVEIYNCVKEADAFLLLDEAFYEFCPEDYDSILLFKDEGYKNVAVIRAATKFFALPGARLGYACASNRTVQMIQTIELPWTINSVANTAGQFIFKDLDYIKKSKEYIQTERDYLLEELKKIEGIEPYHSHTNFILIKLLDFDEEYIFWQLLKKGILVRKCSSFEMLSNNHIRIAVKDRSKNEILIAALKELI